MSNVIKQKLYQVEVRSHTSAQMLVYANSKMEAYQIAERDMQESLARLIKEAKPNPFIKDLSGYTEAMRSSVKVIKK